MDESMEYVTRPEHDAVYAAVIRSLSDLRVDLGQRYTDLSNTFHLEIQPLVTKIGEQNGRVTKSEARLASLEVDREVRRSQTDWGLTFGRAAWGLMTGVGFWLLEHFFGK